MKISATTLGETGGDLLSMTLNVGYELSLLIFLALFLISVTFQLKARAYHPFLYWTVIVATSTAGTEMSDFMDRTLHLGYLRGTIILFSILCAIFVVWRFSGGTMDVEKIRSFRVEVIYWIAILFSNTLGTALGDFLSTSSGLGFEGGALLIGSCLAIILLAKYFTQISRVLLFWFAFVLTRPFGATLGDVLTKSHAQGGLGFGTEGSSLVLLGVLIVTIVISSRINDRKPVAA